MEVYNAKLFNRPMLEYVYEQHPYINKVIGIVDKRESERKTWGRASSKDIYIFFNKIIWAWTRKLSSDLMRTDVELYLNVFRTVLHECRHCWQHSSGFKGNYSMVGYYNSREEKDARKFEKAELLRLANLNSRLYIPQKMDGLVSIIGRKRDQEWINDVRQERDKTGFENIHPKVRWIYSNFIRLYKYNMHIGVSQHDFSKSTQRKIKDMVRKGQIGKLVSSRTGKRHYAYLYAGEWIRLTNYYENYKGILDGSKKGEKDG